MNDPASRIDSRLRPRLPKRRGLVRASRLAFPGLLIFLACTPPPSPLRPAPQAGRLSGSILSIDRPNREIELVATGRRFSVPYSARTLVRNGAASLGLKDIRVGDRVVVSFDHQARAKLITLIGPPREPKTRQPDPRKKSPS